MALFGDQCHNLIDGVIHSQVVCDLPGDAFFVLSFSIKQTCYFSCFSLLCLQIISGNGKGIAITGQNYKNLEKKNLIEPIQTQF